MRIQTRRKIKRIISSQCKKRRKENAEKKLNYRSLKKVGDGSIGKKSRKETAKKNIMWSLSNTHKKKYFKGNSVERDN